jgi:redox-sensitive bicupin YhaK (pirin superfamily)
MMVKDQVGWLDRPAGGGETVLRLRAGETEARVLIYAGEPQEMRLAARGPFIAGSDAELARYFAAYRRGEFPLASSLRQEVG